MDNITKDKADKLLQDLIDSHNDLIKSLGKLYSVFSGFCHFSRIFGKNLINECFFYFFVPSNYFLKMINCYSRNKFYSERYARNYQKRHIIRLPTALSTDSVDNS